MVWRREWESRTDLNSLFQMSQVNSLSHIISASVIQDSLSLIYLFINYFHYYYYVFILLYIYDFKLIKEECLFRPYLTLFYITEFTSSHFIYCLLFITYYLSLSLSLHKSHTICETVAYLRPTTLPMWCSTINTLPCLFSLFFNLLFTKVLIFFKKINFI